MARLSREGLRNRGRFAFVRALELRSAQLPSPPFRAIFAWPMTAATVRPAAAPLAGLRALELPGAEIALCGKMYADLGVEVVKVEPPGGDAGRKVPPLFPGTDGQPVSLYWRAYSRGKRSVTLDLEQEPGRTLLKKLAASADFLIEGYAPGTLARWGLA